MASYPITVTGVPGNYTNNWTVALANNGNNVNFNSVPPVASGNWPVGSSLNGQFDPTTNQVALQLTNTNGTSNLDPLTNCFLLQNTNGANATITCPNKNATLAGLLTGTKSYADVPVAVAPAPLVPANNNFWIWIAVIIIIIIIIIGIAAYQRRRKIAVVE